MPCFVVALWPLLALDNRLDFKLTSTLMERIYIYIHFTYMCVPVRYSVCLYRAGICQIALRKKALGCIGSNPHGTLSWMWMFISATMIQWDNRASFQLVILLINQTHIWNINYYYFQTRAFFSSAAMMPPEVGTQWFCATLCSFSS